MKNILRKFLNKYVLSFIGIVIWTCFFDSNDYFALKELTDKITNLEAEKKYYQDEIKHNKEATLELQTNEKNLEKFAREKYMMKKDNEDVFILVRE